MISTSVLFLALGALLTEATTPDCRRVCTTVHNDCGQSFRSCYNPCKEKPMVPPPCTKPTPAPAPINDDDCHSRTICIDYRNSCGMFYGTCVADCYPRPEPTPPPCPKTTTLESSVRAKQTA